MKRNKGKKGARKKREPKPLQMSNAFIRLLLRHAKEAGTVQIVEGITAEQLDELHEMHKLQVRANPSSAKVFGAYHFSHVYPVKGQKHTGKFVPCNLVIASASLNRSFKNTHLGGGAYIHFSEKNSKWDVQVGMDDKAIMELMIECITRPVWEAFTKVTKLLPSTRQARLDTLGKLLDPTNPEHAAYLKALNTPGISTQDLGMLVEAVTGKEIFQVGGGCYVSPMMMLIVETERMSAYRSELLQVLKVLEQVQQMSSYFAHDSFAITEFDEGLFFDFLHGKTITETTVEVLNDFLVESLTSIYDAAAIRPMFGPAPIDSYSPAQLAEYRAMNVGAVASRENPGASDFWDEVMEQQLAA
ncbi:hypothetical protein [Pseudomonas sp. Irchel s3a18]|uniref:hypothetical protein n=1 Tax=Pseudomonas sp. Irchel s3a18 TaxID=2009053 RepID=UPI00117AB7EB|nr:hypothetical protein [Pseudomonas sp. Irchel s3a18]